MDRLERGEAPEIVLAALASAAATTEDSEPPRPARERPESEGAERRERMDSENFGRFFSRRSEDEFAEILQRPTDEIIALICRELGLSPEWLRHVEEAWESEELSREEGDCRFSRFPAHRKRVGDGAVSDRLTTSDRPGGG